MPRVFYPAALVLSLVLCVRRVAAHGLVIDPPQRGALSSRNKFNPAGTDPDAPPDLKAHFPAGDKGDSPGAGSRSQLRAAGAEGWTPFEPLRTGFRWRAGVCGDELGSEQEHMRGGRYYFGGKVTRTYEAGGVAQMQINVVAHHNGFVEGHLCDVQRCGGEISERCFRDGHCRALRRAANAKCDSGVDKGCAPIDPKYPGRWYLPCRTGPPDTLETLGGDTMTWEVPEDVECEHCVLQWFWSAANTCNPPGVVEFFEGPDGPKNWGQCPGQSGALGGYTKVQKDCGPDRNPEEYYTCADVRVVRREKAVEEEGVGEEANEEEAVSAEDVGEVEKSKGMGRFERFELVGDGRKVGKIENGGEMDVSKYKDVAVEAVVSGGEGSVVFYLNGKRWWKDFRPPYFLYGNVGGTPNYGQLMYNRGFEIAVESRGDRMSVRTTLRK